MNDVIVTSDLTKVYGKTIAVDSVHLQVKKGEVFGFIGLNGAGKTTTIRMLLGMIAPTRGESFIMGEKVKAGNVGLWNHVGYMVETPYSYPELTVKENLEIVWKLRGLKDRSRISWIMDLLELGKYASVKAKHLSLGNGQRLGIAKALIHRPDILILDEPTNGLDPAGIVEVRELLKSLAENEGVTILVSSHNLDEVSRMASTIGIIHNGRLVRKMDTAHLEGELRKTLAVDGRQREVMKEVLLKSGYKPKVTSTLEGSYLELMEDVAVLHPDRVAERLVEAGCPPTLLKVNKENLEAYFLRMIENGEKNHA
ncbi:ABC transporter ATP-binding protein [Bacillus sp. ISL-55]|uniref:ABC transporter ATP-binding protein n=1 Tax=Bacillus sp. ISL-55 TaxID=2819134 RepID=UPI001BEB66B6|nr:ABC transporter ATP-binding protein [Bacillus sp. ISL-55]MBT2694516.1 ABC transporter ATP-binding protein [Bacillus sp. ISL-55]